MNAFTYTDIFATKGIEYLVVIGFLLLLVPVWILLNRSLKLQPVLEASVFGFTAGISDPPKGLFFSRNHTWASMQKNGLAKLGLDDFLLHVTGGVSVEFLKQAGDEVAKGEAIARILQGDKALSISSPVSGVIKENNFILAELEGQVNEDPYGKGWLYKVRAKNWKEEMASCLFAEEAETWAKEEIDRCKEFVVKSVDLPEPMLQTGGELIDYPLQTMHAEVWSNFQKEFLD